MILTGYPSYFDEETTCPFTHECQECEYDCEEEYKMAYKVIEVQHDKGVALVKGNKKAFPVKLTKETKFMVAVGDLCKIERSTVTGKWLMTDYTRMWAGEY